ncbi:hypothetical protein ACP70R_011563 [Stipagrostis hirtigluma subsp. patula]
MEEETTFEVEIARVKGDGREGEEEGTTSMEEMKRRGMVEAGESSRETETGTKSDQNGGGDASKTDSGVEERRKRLREEYEEWRRRREEERGDPDPEKWTDPYAFEGRHFEQWWNAHYANTFYGSFNDRTAIPCMRLTYESVGRTDPTLQVYSVKVAELSEGLQWPLNVYGMVAFRDSLDQNRNIIFDRDRDNCQTITEKDPYLVLTGPVRAVVLCGRVVFEVLLKARGPVESEDKEISLLAAHFRSEPAPFGSFLITESYTSRLSSLQFTLGHIICSVEATITVRVIDGSSPDGFGGRITARTASIAEEVVLLDSGDEKVPVLGDEIKLSRRVASVELDGHLIVSVKVLQGQEVLHSEKEFTPQERGTHFETLNVGSCKINLTIAWSLFEDHPRLLSWRNLSV